VGFLGGFLWFFLCGFFIANPGPRWGGGHGAEVDRRRGGDDLFVLCRATNRRGGPAADTQGTAMGFSLFLLCNIRLGAVSFLGSVLQLHFGTVTYLF
jgi:hypothetical protein